MHRKDQWEVGIRRPYLIEWKYAPFPEKYKPLKLEAYNGKRFPN